jgi:hypothetical protein
MGYTVTIFEAKPEWIAAARGPLATNVSVIMLGLLGQAWDFVKKSGIKTDGQNVAIYRHDVIEAGPLRRHAIGSYCDDDSYGAL